MCGLRTFITGFCVSTVKTPLDKPCLLEIIPHNLQ